MSHRPDPAPEPPAPDPLASVVELVRRILRRAPVGYWLAVMTASVMAAAIVVSTVKASERAATTYGDVRRVPVAAVPLAPGDEIDDADVRWILVPSAFLPAAAVAQEPVGHALIVAVAQGEVLLESKLAPWGRSGAAALMPAGTRAIAVPNGPAVPPVELGDLVDLLATVATEAPGDEPTFFVARDAIVVAVDDDAVTVAVAIDDASRVAFAITAGTITLALTSP
ncbi:MAG TPA: SAF domain-containing protein [Acidimicrobiales bacterium]|nr:SAF domain-containing protein [Acidimicrobiales bacterium]